MTAGWCARTVRAAVFAAVCVLLAALGHVTMSGSPVPWWAMTAGAAATGAVGWALAGRERGLPLIVSVVVAAQTALHSGFSFAQSMTTGTTAAGTAATGMSPTPMVARSVADPMHSNTAGSMAAHHMDHMEHTVHVSSMDGMDHAGFVPGGGSSSSGMLAAHLLAALLCGLWLAYGERAAFRLLRAVAGWLPRPCGCRSRCPPRRTARAGAYAGAARTGRRGGSCSSTRSLLGVRPRGPLSADDSR